MDGKMYIKEFVRDDGEKLGLDGVEIFLAEENELVMRSNPTTTALEYTGADGGEMVRQRNAVFEQTIQGLIVPKTSSYWALAQHLSQFFQINHTYKIIYVGKDGGMYAQHDAWISEGLQVPPTAREQYAYWNITFAVGNTIVTEYAEDSAGEPIAANRVTVSLSNLAVGGREWDGTGAVWDGTGSVWEEGEGGEKVITVQSARSVYPIWTIQGPCVRPKITNRNNGTTAYFDGTVSTGQTLVVDFAAGTARMDGATVSRYLNGLLELQNGANTMSFESDGGAQTRCEIGWNNII